MINYYQPFLLPFLRRTPYRLPSGIRQTYFISFEDALWVLLRAHGIPKKSAVFIPDFYCLDVVENIKNHGYTPVTYKVDSNFRCNPHELSRRIAKEKPGIVIIFHACGLPSLEPKELQLFVRTFPNTLFIEDAVQQLVDPENIRILGTNHCILDSLRKVSPLPGSYLYQSDRSHTIMPDPRFQEFGYYIGSVLLFWIFRLCFTVGILVRSQALIRYSHMNILKRHDDLIGDSTGGYRGLPFIPRIHRFMDFRKFQLRKAYQAKLYMDQLIPFLNARPEWSIPKISRNTYGNLHVFPLILTGHATVHYKQIESYLYEHGIIAWFKFPDAAWNRERMVLYLPLGFHIRSTDIRHIVRVLESLPVNDGYTV